MSTTVIYSHCKPLLADSVTEDITKGWISKRRLVCHALNKLSTLESSLKLARIFSLLSMGVRIGSCKVIVILSDMTKASDRLSHHIFIEKVKSYSITTHLRAWFSSYLTSRIQSVTSDGTPSKPFQITSGVS